MTLVIGRVKNGKIYIFGDTELTFYYKERTNPFVEGCLKQYIVTDKLAVAFSGVKEHFETVCDQLFECRDSNEIVEIALESQSTGLEYNLLIGEVGYAKIRLVRDGKLYEAEAGYIGDSEAFNAFQKFYHASSDSSLSVPELGRGHIKFLRLPEPIFENEIYFRLYQCFKQVIWDNQITGVGGLIVPLCTDKGKFRYINYADVVSDPLKIEEFQDEPKPIKFGTAGGGGYSVEFCDDTPYGGEGREVGYYFLQGGFGVVFPRNEKGFRNAEIIRAKNPAYWVLETNKKLGHGIGSGFLREDHCGIAGEELMRKDRFRDALFCYELRKDSKTLKDRPAVRDRYMVGFATALFNCGKASEAISILQFEIRDNKNSPRCGEMLIKMQREIGSP